MHFPSPKELKTALSLDADARAFITESRETARHIISGSDRRLAILVGPCSIHEIEGSLIYAEKLKTLAERVKESCFLVMRVCVEKPRTGKGWKGLLYDPHLDGSDEIERGLKQSRALFLELARRKVPIVTEFVDPLVSYYFDDLVVWGV
ncbi:MAG: 3-deoxy-7-phosphoheptulonate synthase, partial [Chlamydiales bacterium]